MTTVVAALAFIMAFGAIWVTTEILKRVDSRNEAWMKPHLKKMQAAVDQNHEALMALRQRMDILEKDVRVLKARASVPPQVEKETAAMQSGLNDAERLSPSVQLNG